MLDAYSTDVSSVHDCPRLYKKEGGDVTLGGVHLNTCAIRITEGLVVALELVKNRAEIAELTSRGGDGKAYLLGKYGYKAKLCPHGIGRGASDVAYFLIEQWGRPTHTFLAPGEAPAELADLTGAISFIKIPGYGGQGHMDVWNKTSCVGHGYFDAQKVLFWKLE
jgi:hypothetical protein